MTTRIGKVPVAIPAGAEFTINGKDIVAKGPKGELKWTVPEVISLKIEDGNIVVIPADESKQTNALHGLSRSLIFNMVQGVTVGYSKTLEIVGTGYRAAAQGKGIEMQLGFSHSVKIPEQAGVEFSVPDQNTIIVSGIDKQLVGEVAANIRKVKPPEPYKGKGIRYKDEIVRRKAGKAGK